MVPVKWVVQFLLKIEIVFFFSFYTTETYSSEVSVMLTETNFQKNLIKKTFGNILNCWILLSFKVQVVFLSIFYFAETNSVEVYEMLTETNFQKYFIKKSFGNVLNCWSLLRWGFDNTEGFYIDTHCFPFLCNLSSGTAWCLGIKPVFVFNLKLSTSLVFDIVLMPCMTYQWYIP